MAIFCSSNTLSCTRSQQHIGVPSQQQRVRGATSCCTDATPPGRPRQCLLILDRVALRLRLPARGEEDDLLFSATSLSTQAGQPLARGIVWAATSNTQLAASVATLRNTCQSEEMNRTCDPPTDTVSIGMLRNSRSGVPDTASHVPASSASSSKLKLRALERPSPALSNTPQNSTNDCGPRPASVLPVSSSSPEERPGDAGERGST
eukprot:CAMPEP_0178436688 /NCGR_PEP_ID=MMETSP0689_2-20121128/34570_1 /TAXON_ID=160604 /ORGANISM="Amphidinium massartii, Strain CS-259" /LENGTH=205 /DNA_ID=CAMNT_0020058795 /DNA_START=1111 /DNA_END=1729 /DNA_ORIENTATION=-